MGHKHRYTIYNDGYGYLWVCKKCGFSQAKILAGETANVVHVPIRDRELSEAIK